jgi:hypothetical protein
MSSILGLVSSRSRRYGAALRIHVTTCSKRTSVRVKREETLMPKGKMLVYTDSISPERDAEFNAWYDSVHVPDVLKIDGIIGCTRFKVADSPAADTPGKYLAIYDVEADDFNDILDALVTAFTDGSLPTNDCLVPGPIIFLQPAT